MAAGDEQSERTPTRPRKNVTTENTEDTEKKKSEVGFSVTSVFSVVSAFCCEPSNADGEERKRLFSRHVDGAALAQHALHGNGNTAAEKQQHDKRIVAQRRLHQ